MKFRIMSRQSAESFETKDSHAVISITDPTAENAKLPEQESRKGLLRLKFHDVDRELNIPGVKIVPFSNEDAKKIVEFVAQVKDSVELIVCHCEAGISRSAGVVAALKRIFEEDDSDILHLYLPNMRVRWLILKAHFGESML